MYFFAIFISFKLRRKIDVHKTFTLITNLKLVERLNMIASYL